MDRALWFSSLAGPVAWTLQVIVNYSLEEIACSAGSSSPGRIWGVGVDPIALVWNTLLVVVTVAALGVSVACIRRTRTEDPSTGRRASWMSGAALMSSGLFLIGLLMGYLPVVMLDVCVVGP
ncbi:MAG: hypothetical protein ACLGHL_03255 [Actinomycetota bacterium]